MPSVQQAVSHDRKGDTGSDNRSTASPGDRTVGIPSEEGDVWFLPCSEESHGYLDFRYPTSGTAREEVSVVVSHRVCENCQSSPGLFGPRLEAATLTLTRKSETMN